MEAEIHKQVLLYLSGELDATGREHFEQALQKDLDLQNALKEELQLRFVLQAAARESYQQSPAKENKSISAFSWTYRVAAAVLLLVMFALAYYFLRPTNKVPQDLYAENFQVPMLSSVRASEAPDPNWEEAAQAYQMQEWSQAESKFLVYLDRPAQDIYPQTYLLLGICQMQQEKFEDAIASFSQLEDTLNPYYFDGFWYSALSNLKLGRMETYQTQLEKLKRSKVYVDRAEELLEELQRTPTP
ncbi:MAG: hypothetical protein AAF694_00070 [Bacteroidota bacterium]